MTIQRWLGVLVSVSVAVNAVASFWLEKKRKARMPGTKPYTWGIYVGLTSMFWGTLLCVGTVVMALAAQSRYMVSIIVFAMFVGWVHAWSGYYTIQRRRTAFVVATLISLNFVWWIANTIYGWKRWSELTPRSTPSPRDEHPQAVS
ncbi:MAG TPA: hypothetical protein VGH98_18265 [Gemmatimonadaceae bacterium]|jgi:hypothetical protein